MIVCVNCGQMNETAASRCLRCGASIFEYPSYLGPAGAAPGSPSPPPPHRQPPPPPHRQTPPPPPHRSPYGTSQPVTPPPAPMPTVPPSGLPTMPYVPPPLVQPVVVVGGFVCPYCRTNLPPRLTSHVSPAGWVILVLLLLLCWPLFWVGFFFREEVCRCRNCGRQVA